MGKAYRMKEYKNRITRNKAYDEIASILGIKCLHL